MASSTKQQDYSQWSNAELIKRVTTLERQLNDQNVKLVYKNLYELPKLIA